MVWQEPILLYFATDISGNLFAKEARPIYYAKTTLGGRRKSTVTVERFLRSYPGIYSKQAEWNYAEEDGADEGRAVKDAKWYNSWQQQKTTSDSFNFQFHIFTSQGNNRILNRFQDTLCHPQNHRKCCTRGRLENSTQE